MAGSVFPAIGGALHNFCRITLLNLQDSIKNYFVDIYEVHITWKIQNR